MADDDLQIVRRVLTGHVNDYRMLVERHQDAVFRFVHGLVGHRQAAEDIVQDSFVAAYKKLADFDGRRAKFSTWLFTIARNRAINHRHRSSTRCETSTAPQPMDSRSPAAGVEEAEFYDQLDRALQSLAVEQKTVFVLAEIEGLSYSEIAEIEQVSLGTVKSRLHRAKQRLRSALQAFVREA